MYERRVDLNKPRKKAERMADAKKAAPELLWMALEAKKAAQEPPWRVLDKHGLCNECQEWRCLGNCY